MPANSQQLVDNYLNLDSELDLVTLADGKVSFLLGDGNGALLRENAMAIWESSKVTTNDFSGDGIPELAVAQKYQYQNLF